MKKRTVIISACFIFFFLGSCGVEKPNDNEAVAILKQKISETRIQKYFSNIQIEVLGWKKENNDWIAHVKVTVVSNISDTLLGPRGFERLVQTKRVRKGMSYSKESFVAFSKFGERWLPQSVKNY